MIRPSPPFRADHVGSILRSAPLKEARVRKQKGEIDAAALKVVTKRAPTADEIRDLLFGMRVCKHVKSNAIVFARDNALVGVGAGQMSRVDSARIAARKAELEQLVAMAEDEDSARALGWPTYAEDRGFKAGEKVAAH